MPGQLRLWEQAGPPCSSAQLFPPAVSASVDGPVRLSNYRVQHPYCPLNDSSQGVAIFASTGETCCQSSNVLAVGDAASFGSLCISLTSGLGKLSHTPVLTALSLPGVADPGLSLRTASALCCLISVSSTNLSCEVSMYFFAKTTMRRNISQQLHEIKLMI